MPEVHRRGLEEKRRSRKKNIEGVIARIAAAGSADRLWCASCVIRCAVPAIPIHLLSPESLNQSRLSFAVRCS